MWTVNLASSPTRSTGIPISPSRPHFSTQVPHHRGGVPGSEQQFVCMCVLSVCVCTLISCFIEEADMRVYRSLFRFYLWEKNRTILMNLHGKQRVLFLGSCPALLAQTYFGSLVECNRRGLNPALHTCITIAGEEGSWNTAICCAQPLPLNRLIKLRPTDCTRAIVVFKQHERSKSKSFWASK